MVGDGLSLDVLERDVERVGEAVLLVAVDAHVGALREYPGLEPVAERGELPLLVGHAEARELAGLGESDDVGDVLGAGAASGLLVPAEHEGLDLRALAHVHEADSLGGVELVTRDGQHVDGNGLDVDLRLSGGLHRVRVEDRAVFPAYLRDLRDREESPRLVVRPHRGDELRALRGGELGAQLVEVDLPDAVHRQLHRLVSLRLEPPNGLEDGRMLDGSRDDLEVFAEPVRRAADRGVVGFRRAGGEDDLLGRAVHETGDFLARAVDVLGDAPAELVHGARVAVEPVEERKHHVAHLGRHARGRIVVEIHCLFHW